MPKKQRNNDYSLCDITNYRLIFQDVQHGFPNKPTAMEIDPELNLLAIGTKQGLLRV